MMIELVVIHELIKLGWSIWVIIRRMAEGSVNMMATTEVNGKRNFFLKDSGKDYLPQANCSIANL